MSNFDNIILNIKKDFILNCKNFMELNIALDELDSFDFSNVNNIQEVKAALLFSIIDHSGDFKKEYLKNVLLSEFKKRGTIFFKNNKNEIDELIIEFERDSFLEGDKITNFVEANIVAYLISNLYHFSDETPMYYKEGVPLLSEEDLNNFKEIHEENDFLKITDKNIYNHLDKFIKVSFYGANERDIRDIVAHKNNDLGFYDLENIDHILIF